MGGWSEKRWYMFTGISLFFCILAYFSNRKLARSVSFSGPQSEGTVCGEIIVQNQTKEGKAMKQPPEGTSRVNRLRGQVDIPFLLLTVLLVVIGLVVHAVRLLPFSAYYDLKGNTEGDPFYYSKRQAMYALLGLQSCI